MAKNCMNCAHKKGSGYEFAKCMKAGYYCQTQRTYPDNRCDSNFSGWEPKVTIFDKLKKLFSNRRGNN